MPTDEDIAKGYANRNLEDRLQIAAHIFPGAEGQLTDADTLVITPTNFNTFDRCRFGSLGSI